MSSVSVILRLNKPLKDGSYPLAIQVIKDRKKTVFHIGYSISQNEWEAVKALPAQRLKQRLAIRGNFIHQGVDDVLDAVHNKHKMPPPS